MCITSWQVTATPALPGAPTLTALPASTSPPSSASTVPAFATSALTPVTAAGGPGPRDATDSLSTVSVAPSGSSEASSATAATTPALMPVAVGAAGGDGEAAWSGGSVDRTAEDELRQREILGLAGEYYIAPRDREGHTTANIVHKRICSTHGVPSDSRCILLISLTTPHNPLSVTSPPPPSPNPLVDMLGPKVEGNARLRAMVCAAVVGGPLPEVPRVTAPGGVVAPEIKLVEIDVETFTDHQAVCAGLLRA